MTIINHIYNYMSCYRGPKVYPLSKQEPAAKIQRAWRSYIAHSKQQQAALKIQRVVRGNQGREVAIRYLKEEKQQLAAAHIQKVTRGHQGRKEVENLKWQKTISGSITPKNAQELLLQIARREKHPPTTLLQPVIAFLLNHGADVTTTDNDGRTALHWAAQHGHADLVRMLLKPEKFGLEYDGVDVNARDSYGGSALDIAAYCGHEKVVRLLLAAGVDQASKNNALYEAVSQSHTDIVRLLLYPRNHGFDCDGADANNALNPWMPVVLDPAERGNEELIEVLLAAGVDINDVVGIYDHTALELLAQNGCIESVRLLLYPRDHGFNFDGADQNSINRALRAASWGDPSLADRSVFTEVVKLLLAAGADLKDISTSGATALDWAVCNREVSKLLVIVGHLDQHKKNLDNLVVLPRLLGRFTYPEGVTVDSVKKYYQENREYFTELMAERKESQNTRSVTPIFIK